MHNENMRIQIFIDCKLLVIEKCIIFTVAIKCLFYSEPLERAYWKENQTVINI